ncbi:MAG: GyrI-like domain-containing protein [bacterium]|nr:GyrI-like domain-containing protein [bacterium]
MINVRIEEKPEFTVSGTKVWISGQDNELFGRFWQECNENGTTDTLKKASTDPMENVTQSRIMGISRVEEDPDNRAFDFYIASESENVEGFEVFQIKAGKWAIFTGDGKDAMALIRAEMEAFMNWLPNSDYIHDFRPELEVYPETEDVYVEFWLPIKEKE